MIGLDTNVIVRLLTTDDQKQTAMATAFMATRSGEDPAFVSDVVLAEVAWVLRDVFGYPRLQVIEALMWLFESSNVRVEREPAMREAIATAQAKNADVSDSIIATIAMEEGASHTVTFDRPAATRIPGMVLLK